VKKDEDFCAFDLFRALDFSFFAALSRGGGRKQQQARFTSTSLSSGPRLSFVARACISFVASACISFIASACLPSRTLATAAVL
jgi:hypothetical protein